MLLQLVYICIDTCIFSQLISIQITVNQIYWGIFSTYSDIFWALCNHGIFRTLVCSESCHIQSQSTFRALVYLKLWDIQNQKHIQTAGLFRTLEYSELERYPESYQTSTMRTSFENQVEAIIIFASYNHFRNISFSCLLFHKMEV